MFQHCALSSYALDCALLSHASLARRLQDRTGQPANTGPGVGGEFAEAAGEECFLQSRVPASL